MAHVYLAFDYGEKRIGVAIGNTLTKQARSLTTLTHETVAERFSKIAALLKEWQPHELVVGLPTHPNGDSHEMTARCKKFGHQLHGRFNLPVHFVDERYSSIIAHHQGATQQTIDQEAAALILQQFLDQTDPFTDLTS